MKVLALALIAFGFCGRALAGGTIGGVPPSVMVDAIEFARIAADAVRGMDVTIDDELMLPETLNFKERTITMRSKTDPEKTVHVKVLPDKESSL
jgi:hypothetical protein